MKTLILYATKHGATKEIAERISALIPDSIVCDLKSSGIPDVSEFDCVIIGGSIYAGSIRRATKDFAAKNTDILLNKQIGLFVSSMTQGKYEQAFSTNFPADLLSAAKATANLGGIYDPGKAGFFERIIMRIVTKGSKYISSISDVQIKLFVSALK